MHYLTVPVEAVIEAQVALPIETTNSEEGCLTSVFAIVNNLLRQFETEENIAAVDTDIRNFKQGNLIAADYDQQLLTKP